MHNKPFSQQLGHYELLNKLGEGGMGIVYLAHDHRLQRNVAVKCLKPGLQGDDLKDLQARLRREATMLAKLNHPNIVQIYDTIQDQDHLALVMEFVEGSNLHRYLREHIVSTRQRLVWLKQIADGLAAAHSEGLIHRDLKADNLLVNKQGVIKITDFGIAKYSHSEHPDYTETGKLLGSYSALSPEQALGQVLDARSDFFSLGIIAFKLLCGRHPFSNNGNHNVLVQNILHLPPLPAKSLNPELPDELVSLLERLLAKLPQQRPTNAKEICQELDRCINQFEESECNPDFSDTLDLDLSAYDTPLKNSSFHSQPSGARETQTATHTRVIRFLKYGLVCLAALVVLAASYWGSQQLLKPDPLYVAVLPPRINADSAMNPEQQHLVLNVLADGLQRSVLNTKTLLLISPQEVAKHSGSHGDIARAVAANVIIESALECQQTSCNISLSRIQPAQRHNDAGNTPWVVTHRQGWQYLDLDDLLLLNETSQGRLATLFPEHNPTPSKNIALSENDYALFIKWQHEALIAGKNYQNILNNLNAAQEKYRFYIPFYDLYAFLSIKLYDDSQDKQYLQQMRGQLDLANNLMPNELSIQRARVILLSRQEDNIATMAALKHFQRLNTNRHEVLQLSAKVAEQQADYQQAIRLLTKVVELRPTRRNWYDLALDQVIIGATKEAKENLQRVLSLSPNDYEALQLQGHIAIGEGDLETAVRAYQQAAKRNPQGHNFNNLGLAYLLQRDFKQAHSAYRRAVELTPQNALHLLGLADSLQLLKQPEQAKRYYQKVITLEAENSDWSSLANKAQAYGQLQNDAEAIKALHQSLRLAPDNGDVLFTAALVYSLTGQWSTALVSIERSLSQGLNPVWYSLPWFDPLCSEKAERLNSIMAAAGSAIHCAKNRITIPARSAL